MVRVIGHRGASATHLENTLDAFRAAADQGAHGIELDVRRTADDVLVVFHDAHLASGKIVREVQAAELPSFVPTLAEALEACADIWINIEIKNLPEDPDYDAEHGLSIAVAGLVVAFDAADRVIVSSFDIGSVDRIRDMDPAIPLGWLVWGQADPLSLIQRAVAHEVQAIHPHDLQVDAGFVAKAKGAGLEINVWTVDDPERAIELAELGVDGIITNAPGPIVAALG
ncbi:MAG: glycerophosphodiester phosphodiesterase [Actinomycetia bacterium]|nr:glycerophosphodiester phosphodiesterase [Actinomycetes bacterium]MCP5034459.1 glycerophosphodiester phosphodiesterase [Actinomycetes bacterium]